MKFCIYQINLDRDTDRVAFEGIENLQRYHGTTEIRSDLYDKVYEGNIDCSSLEDLFRIFNIDHPADYPGRSMSGSDIVEIQDNGGRGKEPGFYFCDSIGFKKVDFQPEIAGQQEINPAMHMTGY